MNNSTSKDMMEREFDILQSLGRLEPPAHLYDSILSQTSAGVLTVSKKWLAAAAVIMAFVVCAEFIIIVKSNQSENIQNIETLIQEENHQLYE
jgi:hypothetical protein